MSKISALPRAFFRTPIEIACLPDETVIAEEEVAVLLDCSAATIHRWRREGRGPKCLEETTHADVAKYRLGDVRRWWTRNGDTGS
jgi:hypothetical protein